MTRPRVSSHYDLRKRIPPESAFAAGHERNTLSHARSGDLNDYTPFSRDHGRYLAPVWHGHRAHPGGRNIDLLCAADPRVRRWGQAALLHERQMEWRAARLNATIRALKPTTNDLHARWLAAHRIHFGWMARHAESDDQLHIFDITTAYATPAGIPSPDPSPDELPRIGADLAPEFPTLWDVENAATLEIEEHIGSARINYEAILTEMGSDDHKAILRRIGKYHLYLNRNIPKHPYDTLIWGHDDRLRALGVTDTRGRNPITLTPAFDPEITEYTTNDVIAPPAGILMEMRDENAPRPTFEYEDPGAGYSILRVDAVSSSGKKRSYYIRAQ